MVPVGGRPGDELQQKVDQAANSDSRVERIWVGGLGRFRV